VSTSSLVAFAFPGIGFIAQQATRLIYVGGADSQWSGRKCDLTQRGTRVKSPATSPSGGWPRGQ
jgi:hypothetical protein